MHMHLHSSLWYVDGLWVPLLLSYVSGVLGTGTYVYDVVVSCYVPSVGCRVQWVPSAESCQTDFFQAHVHRHQLVEVPVGLNIQLQASGDRVRTLRITRGPQLGPQVMLMISLNTDSNLGSRLVRILRPTYLRTYVGSNTYSPEYKVRIRFRHSCAYN